MSPHLALRFGFSGIIGLLLGASSVAAAPVVPSGFVVENALFNNAGFNNPTAIATLPDGRWIVAEKRGVAWMVINGVKSTKPAWSATDEVLNSGDRGLISVAVDPHFAMNRRVYFLYTVDPDSNGVDDPQVAFARITRYEMSATDSNEVDPSTRTVLIGATWSEGIPSPSLSHGAAHLDWGQDGSLLVSHGDGAHYEFYDGGGRDSAQFFPGRTDPSEDIGSFRSQDPASLAGKVLRINPETGRGYASNPFASGDLASSASKVWALGFRNPFRFCVRPGTGSSDTSDARPGTLFVGDVGLNTWEEINVVDRPAMNLGWPCREGRAAHATYQTIRPAHHGCDAVDAASLTDPAIVWHHSDSTKSVPYGLAGNCTAGGIFYSASTYPQQYRDRLFFGDFGEGWLQVATLDSLHQVTQMQPFGSALEGPVDWAIDPQSGDLLYVSIYTGQVRRIHYTGEGVVELPPVAVASATPMVGDSPATIDFSSLGSFDPSGLPIRCVWNFGDQSPPSIESHPSHVYLSSGEYIAVLTVSTASGRVARDTIEIVIASAAGFPTASVLDSLTGPNRPLSSPWVGNLSGLAVQGGALIQTISPSYAIWSAAAFGANQEAHVRFDSVTASSPEHALLLKVQGASWANGTIQVAYVASQSSITISTYTPGVGWTRRGGPWAVTFAKGDRFGARAFSNGVVVAYKNREAIGSATVLGWPWAKGGGRVGFKLLGASASRLVEFGGGDVAVTRRTAPRARILSPADRTFFVAGDHIVLAGAAEDDEDAPAAIRLQWGVDLIHNNHTHPSVATFTAAVDSFEAEDHDDGTGVWYKAHLFATDPAGLVDTATVSLFPDVNLAAGTITTTPARPTVGSASTYAFTLYNRGRMPAPFSRWAIVAGNGVLIARGDTAVAALDSVRVERTLPSLPTGAYTLRAVADTMNGVVETDESDNASVRTFAVVDFPVTPVIDSFARPDGALSAPWVGSLSGLAVRNQALVHLGSSNYAVWNGAVHGADQEAYVRFDSLTSTSTEHDLLLKVQGTAWTSGAVQVIYSPSAGTVVVNTFTPGMGWARRGGPWKVTFAAGDQLGARAMGDGTVRVYRNGVKIGETALTGWPFAANGGRIGLLLNRATASRLADFGGGTMARPRATIVRPATRSWFVAGKSIALEGRAEHAQLPAAALTLRWLVDRVHATGVDAGVFVSSAPADSFLAAPGSLTYRVRLIATDSAGLTDTAEVVVSPEVDLKPSTIVTAPLQPTGLGFTTYAFTLSNLGRMPAPISRWAIVANGVTVALGDTAVAALDSVRIVRTVPSLPAGLHLLCAVADTLGAVAEIDETNNRSLRSITVIEFPSTAVIDSFARADGPIGAPWVGSVSGFAIRNRALVHTGTSNYAVWNATSFGPDQEAFVRFDSLTATSPEHDLLLKVQGTTWTSGAIQVTYSPLAGTVVVNTYTPGSGWSRRAGPWRTILVPGDQLGARALADGTIRVFKNGVTLGEATLGNWPFASKGGRIGILLHRASSSRLVHFGGGDARRDSGATPGIVASTAASDTLVRGVDTQSTRPAVHELPRVLTLSNAFPNPARHGTSFALELPAASEVSLSVFDVQGRLVWEAPARMMEAGRWTLRWPGATRSSPAAPGIYLASVRIGERTLLRRVTVVR